MAALGAAYANAVLDALLGAGHVSAVPATVYVALFSDLPGTTELTGGAYARVAVTNDNTNWPAAAGQSKSNGTVIAFPTATANWGSVLSWAVMDAASAGSVILKAQLTTAKTISIGETAEFVAGQLVVTAA